jgi:hypothetical protein
MRHSAESIFVVENLREFESICKTVLANESGDPGVQFYEKNRGSKISYTVPLNQRHFKAYFIVNIDILVVKVWALKA